MRVPWNPAPISDIIVQKAQVQRLPRCRLNKSRLSRGKLPWHMANEAGAYLQRLGSDCDAPLRIVTPRPITRTTNYVPVVRLDLTEVSPALPTS